MESRLLMPVVIYVIAHLLDQGLNEMGAWWRVITFRDLNLTLSPLPWARIDAVNRNALELL